jgi:hypothetical protein
MAKDRLLALLRVFAAFGVVSLTLLSSCQAAETGGFDLYDSYDFEGLEPETAAVGQVEDCSSRCQADSKCQAFSFNKWDHRCKLGRQPAAFRFDARFIGGLATGKAAPASSEKPIVLECSAGVAATGATPTAAPGQTLPECAEKCEADSNCVAFNFSEEKRVCALFVSALATVSDAQQKLGFKHQLGAGEDIDASRLCPTPALEEIKTILAISNPNRDQLARAQSLCQSSYFCPTVYRDAIAGGLTRFQEEEQIFNSAQDDESALEKYITECKACEFDTVAENRLTELRNARLAEKENQSRRQNSQPGIAVAVGNVAKGRVEAFSAFDEPDEATAQEKVLNRCGSQAAACKIASASGSGCISVAGVGRVWSVRGASSKGDASRLALGECGKLARHCATILTACNSTDRVTAQTGVDCGIADGLRSVVAKRPAVITLSNNTSGNVSVYWLDYEGKRELYSIMRPSETYTANTFATHPWIVTDSTGSCLNIINPDISLDHAQKFQIE